MAKNSANQLIHNALRSNCTTPLWGAFLGFSSFTGLAYSDIHELKYDDIKTNFDERLWIMKKRVKTGTDITVPLTDIPLSIIERYRNKQKGGKVLPTMCNQKMNSYLKEIADVCGIEKNLTFHMARHSKIHYPLSVN